jgi:hypothetical protein
MNTANFGLASNSWLSNNFLPGISKFRHNFGG